MEAEENLLEQRRAHKKSGNSRHGKKSFVQIMSGIPVLCCFDLHHFIYNVYIMNSEKLSGIEKYPRLPDLLLDALPIIDHAYEISELIAISMVLLWISLLVFHKHKIVILRRMFSLFGSVFLLRSFTMLGLGHVVEHTCFSGHVATLTMLNFCITEYTPSSWKFVHVISWSRALFGRCIFGFFHQSRMFLSYHTHAYNHPRLAKTDWRVRVWYPLSWIFEAGSTGKVANEYVVPMWIYRKRGRIQIKVSENDSDTRTVIDSHSVVRVVGSSNIIDGANGNYRMKITILNKDELIRRVESPDTRAKSLFKLGVSFVYCQLIVLITSMVMVVVDTRVPQYPPLPDLVLSNLPLIPWAFELCELIIISMALFLLTVIVFHKHRVIIMRRMFALGGTVFLTRCLTMLVTSLSVPGIHFECQAGRYDTLSEQFKHAIDIWLHMGMSIQGVRTCGDYIEYTPSDWHMVHTTGWILAGHEHYSIDVFMAFYIASRMFLYYHTNAYNLWNLTNTDWRVRVWFPLGWFFEAGGLGKVENEFDLPWEGSLSDVDSIVVEG
uniref:Sphingomyelin synthase-like domain-containing protein n=1 Tax=Ditylenchus dipsaci TaxID=166011 RepID=A0A915E536_9BILA